jgi:hypothetical protein
VSVNKRGVVLLWMDLSCETVPGTGEVASFPGFILCILVPFVTVCIEIDVRLDRLLLQNVTHISCISGLTLREQKPFKVTTLHRASDDF